MTQEEKGEATEDTVAELEERKLDAQKPRPNVGLSAFHDARKTLDVVENAVRILFHQLYLPADGHS